jgi:hypothetical protein
MRHNKAAHTNTQAYSVWKVSLSPVLPLPILESRMLTYKYLCRETAIWRWRQQVASNLVTIFQTTRRHTLEDSNHRISSHGDRSLVYHELLQRFDIHHFFSTKIYLRNCLLGYNVIYFGKKYVASTFRAKNKPTKKGQNQAATEDRLNIVITVTTSYVISCLGFYCFVSSVHRTPYYRVIHLCFVLRWSRFKFLPEKRIPPMRFSWFFSALSGGWRFMTLRDMLRFCFDLLLPIWSLFPLWSIGLICQFRDHFHRR